MSSYRISSISKAAGMVSISTVARIVPWSMPRLLLGEAEDVVPQPGFQVAFHLRQVEVGAAAAGDQLAGVVEEVQPEIDQRAHGRCTVDEQVTFVEMPPAGSGHDHRERPVGGQPVRLALRGGELQPAPDGVEQGDLAADDVRPVRGVRVLQVGQPHLRAGVQRVDRHLRLRRSGDLHPPINQIGRRRRHQPIRAAGSGRCPAGSPAARCGRPRRGVRCGWPAARLGGGRIAAANRRRTPPHRWSGCRPTVGPRARGPRRPHCRCWCHSLFSHFRLHDELGGTEWAGPGGRPAT